MIRPFMQTLGLISAIMCIFSTQNVLSTWKAILKVDEVVLSQLLKSF